MRSRLWVSPFLPSAIFAYFTVFEGRTKRLFDP
jgi:hypothetical protein